MTFSKDYTLTRVTTSALLNTGAARVFGILLLGGTTASTLELHSTAAASGTQIIEFVAPFTDTDASAASSVYFDFTNFGGIEMATHLSEPLHR